MCSCCGPKNLRCWGFTSLIAALFILISMIGPLAALGGLEGMGMRAGLEFLSCASLLLCFWLRALTDASTARTFTCKVVTCAQASGGFNGGSTTNGGTGGYTVTMSMISSSPVSLTDGSTITTAVADAAGVTPDKVTYSSVST